MYRCCEANGYKFSKRKKGKSSILKLLAGKYRHVYYRAHFCCCQSPSCMLSFSQLTKLIYSFCLILLYL